MNEKATPLRTLAAIVLFVVFLVPAIVIVADLSPPVLGLAVLAVPIGVISGVAAIVAAVRGLNSRQTALVAAGISLSVILVLGLTGAVFVKGSGPSCDGFCFTRPQARVLVLIVAASYGLLIAVSSAVVTAVFVAVIRRPAAPR